MCGIVGYIGKQQALPILVEGLKRLAHRGYDSSGLCIQGEKGLQIRKAAGKVTELEKLIENEVLPGTLGIAHTRWATHGLAIGRNAHPHTDCTQRFAIVHNGIIENYDALKKVLQQEGHVFKSDTDSEVLAHLIEKYHAGSLSDAVKSALSLIEGTCGILAIDTTAKVLVAANIGSSMLVGVLVGDGYMVASTQDPFYQFKSIYDSHCSQGKVCLKEVMSIEFGQIVEMRPNGYDISQLDGSPCNRQVVIEIAKKAEDIDRGNFAHFMLKEIFEQPDALQRTLAGRIDDKKIKISAHIFEATKIRIIGCGTSYYAGLLGHYLIEGMCAHLVRVELASEFAYRNPWLSDGELFVFISQSGETADTLTALRLVNEYRHKTSHIRTIGICNVVNSSIARKVDAGIYLHAGPEIGVASTKAFTCQVAALLLLALDSRRSERLGDERLKMVKELQLIPEKMRKVLEQSDAIRGIAKEFVNSTNFLFLGRDINYPVALEGALKLKEISYIHAEGMSAGEMKHGPIALIDENMPVVVIVPDGPLCEKVLTNMSEVKARGGRMIAVTSESVDGRVDELAEQVIRVPDTLYELSPLLNVVPLQLLAYHIADLKGLDVDKPRNLAKTVTVE